jgi:hypothetical protein
MSAQVPVWTVVVLPIVTLLVGFFGAIVTEYVRGGIAGKAQRTEQKLSLPRAGPPSSGRPSWLCRTRPTS